MITIINNIPKQFRTFKVYEIICEIYKNTKLNYIECSGNDMTACELNDLFYHLPVCASTPTNANLFIAGISDKANEAETSETSCSLEHPPNKTRICFRTIAIPSCKTAGSADRKALCAGRINFPQEDSLQYKRLRPAAYMVAGRSLGDFKTF